MSLPEIWILFYYSIFHSNGIRITGIWLMNWNGLDELTIFLGNTQRILEIKRMHGIWINLNVNLTVHFCYNDNWSFWNNKLKNNTKDPICKVQWGILLLLDCFVFPSLVKSDFSKKKLKDSWPNIGNKVLWGKCLMF